MLYMKYLTVYDIIKKRPDFKQQPVQLIILSVYFTKLKVKCLLCTNLLTSGNVSRIEVGYV